MPVAQVSSSTVDYLVCLLMDTSLPRTRSQIRMLLARSTDPIQVVRVWAAINFFNHSKSSRIKQITGWHDFEVYEYLLQIRWESPRRNLEQLRFARDSSDPNPPRQQKLKI